MINGHGDDIFRYKDIRINFSSNVYAHFDHTGLFRHLREVLPLISNYPEPSPQSLEQELARQHGISPENVMVTNGATEAIYLTARAYSDRRMLIPQPTFSEYADACRDTASHGEPMHWLCNPNNPTGRVVEKNDLPQGPLVLDASYAAYTSVPLLTPSEAVQRGNVLMLRSMTKDYGIPGIRLGYVIASAPMLAPLRALRMPWSIGAIALQAGHWLVQHHDDYEIPVDMLLSERERLAASFTAMGITTSHSDCNILLCQLPSGSASSFKERLAVEHGILIRDASNFQKLTPQHFRIAAQLPDENDALIAAMQNILNYHR